MIVYILFAVLAVLLTLIAFGFTIYGGIKKKRALFLGSLASSVVLSLVSIFAVYTYGKEQLAYMNSDEFGEETRMMGENIGKKLGNTISGTADGLEQTLDEDAIERLSEKGSRIIGKGIKASAKGFDETLGKTTVYLDETADAIGIKIGRAEEILDSSKSSIALYLEFTQDIDTSIQLTAYDSKGDKMDNVRLPIKSFAGAEKIHKFRFDYFSPGLSGYCILSVAK